MKTIALLILLLTITYQSQTAIFLVYGGKTGYIGQKLVSLLQERGHTTICAQARLENRESLIQEIETTNPDYIINAAGITGRPNVDWCEDHKPETIRVNVVGTLNLADIAWQHNIHLTNISTGCIYQYDEAHTIENGRGFTEEDEPNFRGSYYSYTKIIVEELIKAYDNVLQLRIRMPISDDLNPRGFIGKIKQYKKLVNIPNSMCVLYDVLPLVITMTEHQCKGIYNMVNPGSISHNEVIDLYKQYIDPTHSYENFSMEEQAKVLKSGRSNCVLDTTKLQNFLKQLPGSPTIPHIKDSIVNVFERMKQKMPSYEQFIWLVQNGNKKIIEQYITDYALDPNQKDEPGNTPLMHAVQEGNISGVRALLAKGADVTPVCTTSETPMTAKEIAQSMAVKWQKTPELFLPGTLLRIVSGIEIDEEQVSTGNTYLKCAEILEQAEKNVTTFNLYGHHNYRIMK